MTATFYDYARSPLASSGVGSVVVIGNLDGLHLGHQALISEAARRASALGAALCALTFDPHPARYFSSLSPAGSGRPAPAALYSVEERLSLLGALGVERVLCQRFDAPFAALSPEEFVREVLSGALRARAVVVGADFAFGAGRAGRVEDLARLCGEEGVEVCVAPQRRAPTGEVYSSTWLRALVSEGRVALAREALGRPYHVRGAVARGHQRGRALGFPTANLALRGDLCPAPGVYAGWMAWGEGLNGREGGSGRAPCVVSVGENPTFSEPHLLAARQRWSVEAHALLDPAAPAPDLYGREVVLWFGARLRDMRRFEGPEALRAQISLDCDEARRFAAAEGGLPAWPPLSERA